MRVLLAAADACAGVLVCIFRDKERHLRAKRFQW